MRHLIDIVLANKELFGALIALALSELLPFVKQTKAEGIIHGLLRLLKKPVPAIAQPDDASQR